MLHFAYDGSIHGDWVARYATRMATRLPDPRLRILYVDERQLSRDDLERRLDRIAAAAAELALPLEVEVAAVGKRGVAETLLAMVPPDPEHLLVCGTRIRHKGRGFLTDTVSEHLLRVGRCRVLSLRVMQPGLLGAPRNFLVPASGRPGVFLRAGLPFLRLLASHAGEVEVLFVQRVSRRRFRELTHAEAARLSARGQRHVTAIENVLSVELDLAPGVLDGTVVLSDDVPKEIVIHAGKHKAELIYMGASARSLAPRSVYGNPIEQVLRAAPCDVAIYGDPS